MDFLDTCFAVAWIGDDNDNDDCVGDDDGNYDDFDGR